MDVADDSFVFSFIVGLHFPYAQSNETGFTVRNKLETSSLDDFRYSLVELERWRRVAFDLYGNVASLICENCFLRFAFI